MAGTKRIPGVKKFTLGLLLGLLLGAPVLAWAVAYTTGGAGAVSADQNLFETIDAPSGTDPVADTSTDTLQILCDDGVTCTGDSTADSVEWDVAIQTSGADADSATTQSDSGLEFVSNELVLLRGCADNEILKWDETQDDWNCEADTGDAAELPRSYLTGLVLSDDATDQDAVDIAVGLARDSTNVADLILSTAIQKNCDVAFAVGDNQGGLDTGVYAAGWYYIHLIRRSDTGVVDALCSTSATSPTMPANFDQRRRIGAVFASATPDIQDFSQHGDQFLWEDPPLDVNVTNQGASAVLYTLTVPTSIQTIALLHVGHSRSTTGARLYMSSPDVDDEAPGSGGPIGSSRTTVASSLRIGEMRIRTNSLGQIRGRASEVSTTINITTLGWIDRRGRDD